MNTSFNTALDAPAYFDPAFDARAAAQMERIVQDLGLLYQQRNEALKEVAMAHQEALLRLSLAAEYKDDDTGVHIVRIGYLAERLAQLLGHTETFSTLLRNAAPMHDVGKIGIPDSVLKKPGPLDVEERKIMNRHAFIGAEILGQSRVPLFQMATDVALCHHERYDGRGYPNGLAGDRIPLSARIVSVVDFFDALLMHRVYRKALAADDVRAMMVEQVGKAFDPEVVNVFLAHFGAMVRFRQRMCDSDLGINHLIDIARGHCSPFHFGADAGTASILETAP